MASCSAGKALRHGSTALHRARDGEAEDEARRQRPQDQHDRRATPRPSARARERGPGGSRTGRSFEGIVEPAGGVDDQDARRRSGVGIWTGVALWSVPPPGRAAWTGIVARRDGRTALARRAGRDAAPGAEDRGDGRQAAERARVRGRLRSASRAGDALPRARRGSARAISSADAKRCAGSFCSARSTNGEIGASCGSTLSSGSGVHVSTAARRAYSVGAGNATRPVSISQIMTPALHRSARGSTSRGSFTCSGLMYAGVPRSTPVRVREPMPPAASITLAIPKSSSLIETARSARARGTRSPA